LQKGRLKGEREIAIAGAVARTVGNAVGDGRLGKVTSGLR
jgi:hypothetical protein